jgi:dUTPase
MAQFETPNAMESSRRATRGNAGLDLNSATRLVLTPGMVIQLVDTDFKGPLPADTVGLILGEKLGYYAKINSSSGSDRSRFYRTN